MRKSKKKKTKVDIYLSIRKPTPKTGGPFKVKGKKRFDWRKEIVDCD